MTAPRTPGTPARAATISEALEALEDKARHGADLRHALACSLALESLWPGVFQITGPHKVRTHWHGGGGILRFTIKAPDDTTQDYARPQVPEILRDSKAEAVALEYFRRTVPQRAARFLEGRI